MCTKMITLVVCAVIIAAITYALVKGLWVASRKITVPIQIVLFVVMLICVGRILFTKENATKLYDGIEQSGISQNMEKTVRTALSMKPGEKAVPAAVSASASASVASAPASASVSVPAPVAVAPAPDPAAAAPATALAATSVAVAPVPDPVAAAPATAPAATSVAKTAPEIKPDYSRFDKGRKSFSFALPFGAQLKVGFRDGTYRIISESLGTLDDSEKKEVGKMVMNALSEYSGEKVTSIDKSQVTFDVQYDESINRTRVFVTVPPSAIK